jgi:hypothetical protein
MRIISFTLFLLFTFGILVKANVVSLLKKPKSPIELTSSETDEESRSCDDDNSKEDKNKEIEDKNIHTPYSTLIAKYKFNYNKHVLNFFKIRFKSHFKEIVTPPPELV